MKVVIAQTGSASCIARDWNVTGSQGNASGCVIKNVWRPREVSLSHLLLLCPWETSASRESLQWTIHVWYPSLAQVVKLIFKRSLREKPTFRDTTTSFHAKWFLTNERRNSILMTCHYPDLGNASDWSCRVGNLLFLRGNQWWDRKMLAAFPGYGNNWRIQLSNTQFIKGIRGGNTPAYSYFIFLFLFYFFSINPIGLVGGFEFTVFFLKKFERMAGEAKDVCLWVLKESKKSRFDSYSVRNIVLRISHITFRDCRVHIFSDNLPRNSRNLVRLENPVQNLPVLLPLDFLDCGFLLALPALGLSFTLASSWIYHNKTRHNKYEDEYVEISNRPWRTIH